MILNKPLIFYAINNAKKSHLIDFVLVTTEDEEISRIAKLYDVPVINRPNRLSEDSSTLDPVIYHALEKHEELMNQRYDIVVTLQPTSPLLKTKSLDSAIKSLIEGPFDSLISVHNKPHLSWRETANGFAPNYTERLNRQSLPKNYVETGAFVISKRDSITKTGRLGKNVGVFPLDDREALDIDSYHDWWIAKKELSKKTILIRVEGYREIGLGHIYRGLTLAKRISNHNVRFLISNKSDIGIKKLEQFNYDYDVFDKDEEIIGLIDDYKADIFVNDILDTSARYMKMLNTKNVKIVNFEDLGPGSKYADLVINDLYTKQNDFNNHYWGSKFYCIRDEFLITPPYKFNPEVKNVLVSFGGTDPSDLTKKVIEVITNNKFKNVKFTVILGIGYSKKLEIQETLEKQANIRLLQDIKFMSEFMSEADLAITSQGRTMYEMAAMEVPTILLAQNERELNHEFGYMQNGFINLGLGAKVDHQSIEQTLFWLVNSPQIRKQMHFQMKKLDLRKGIERVLDLIFKGDDSCD